MDNYSEEKLIAFTKEYGKDYAGMKPHERSAMFERMVAYYLLRKRHLENLRLADVEPVVVGGTLDNQLDAIAIIMDGCLISNERELAAQFAERDPCAIQIVFIQATQSNRFDLQRMTTFSAGVTDFLNNHSFLPENALLSRKKALAQSMITRLTEEARIKIQIIVYFVCLGKWGGDPEQGGWRARTENEVIKAGFPSVVVEVVDSKRLRQFIDLVTEDDSLSVLEHPKDYVRVIKAKSIVPFPDREGAPIGYIGVLEANEFIKLLETEDGQGLEEGVFMDNVRGFKGLSSPVNEKIAETLTGANRADFLLLNNGVTIVAPLAEYNQKSGELRLANYQIVNGLQSSYVLYHERRAYQNSDTVLVPIKIAVTKNLSLKHAIIDSTNRQTAITEMDYLSRRPIIKQIEAYFAQCRSDGRGPELWLARRSGQHLDIDEKKRSHVFELPELMLAYVSVILGMPHEAKQGIATVAQRIPATVFNDVHRPHSYYLAAWLYLLAKEEIAKNSKLEGTELYFALGLRWMLEVTGYPLKGTEEQKSNYCQQLTQKLSNKKEVTKAVRIVAPQVARLPTKTPRGKNALLLSTTTTAFRKQIAAARGGK